MSGTPTLQPGDDPYQILGIGPDASDAEITRAYRRLLRQHHPDTAPGQAPLDHHRLGQILAAYQQLRRDRALATNTTSGTALPVTVHHNDRPAAVHPAQRRRPGPDDVWLGNRPVRDHYDPARRRILIAHRGIDTTAAVTITPTQVRTGAIVTVAVPDDPTHGHRLRNIRVRIPPSTAHGQTLRIPGHGNPGTHGGPPGDLQLTVYHAVPDPP